MMKTLLLLASLLCHTAAYAVQQRVFFTPGSTDPAITQYNNNHYAVVDPAVPPRKRLMLFFPGTGGVPLVYSDFVENAASLGFHGLGLMYPNGESVNELCTANDPANSNASFDARLEIFDGTDRVPYVSVDRANSIENRLLKALQYLHATYPTRGWGQYFSANTILWDTIIVCGHSQGGGHAALIAKTRKVDRCLLFGWVDWWNMGRRPYDWLSSKPVTSPAQWYELAHERDQEVPFLIMRPSVAAMDVDRYGDYLRVDTSTPDYLARHFLTTNLEPARGANGSYHGTMISDLDTPRQSDGTTPVLKPAWDDMLLHETAPITLTLTASETQIVFSPGILESSTNLQSWQPVAGADSPWAVPRSQLPARQFFRLLPER